MASPDHPKPSKLNREICLITAKSMQRGICNLVWDILSHASSRCVQTLLLPTWLGDTPVHKAYANPLSILSLSRWQLAAWGLFTPTGSKGITGNSAAEPNRQAVFRKASNQVYCFKALTSLPFYLKCTICSRCWWKSLSCWKLPWGEKEAVSDGPGETSAYFQSPTSSIPNSRPGKHTPGEDFPALQSPS